MIAKHLDNPAIGNPSARALVNHTFQLGLQRRQSCQSAFDFGQLRPGYGICGGAGLVGVVQETKEVANRLDREAQIACMPDEGQPFDSLAIVEPLMSRAALGLWQEADLLVVADGRHLHAGLRPELSNGEHQILP